MKLLLTITLTFLLVLSPGWSAENQAEAHSFVSFWRKFKTSLAKGDKEEIAAMTNLPFSHQSKQLSKTDFLKAYVSIFGPETRKCFRNAKPVKDEGRDTFSVFCGSVIYVFEKVQGEYRFTDTAEND